MSKDKTIDFSKALEYIEPPNEISIQEDKETDSPIFNGNQLKNLMLRELNNLSDIIIKHPDFLINQMSNEEKMLLKDFLTSFSTCPICHRKNHSYNLKKVFVEEDNDFLSVLHRLMDHRIKIKFGIPCCLCYKEIFEKD